MQKIAEMEKKDARKGILFPAFFHSFFQINNFLSYILFFYFSNFLDFFKIFIYILYILHKFYAFQKPQQKSYL